MGGSTPDNITGSVSFESNSKNSIFSKTSSIAKNLKYPLLEENDAEENKERFTRKKSASTTDVWSIPRVVGKEKVLTHSAEIGPIPSKLDDIMPINNTLTLRKGGK